MWNKTSEGIPPKGEDVLILFVDGNCRVKRIFDKSGEPRWGFVGGGIPLEKAPYWMWLPAKPDGFVVKRSKAKPVNVVITNRREK